MAKSKRASLTAQQALPLLEEALGKGQKLAKQRSIALADAEAWIEQVSALLTATYGSPSPQHKKLNEATYTADLYKSHTRDRQGKIEGRYDEAVRTTVTDLALNIQLLRASTQTDAVPVQGTSRPATAKKIFVGHGRNPSWRELQRFIEKRLNLETDDFDGVFAAGKTVVGRLEEMLDSAAFAFLVMTAEDALSDDEVRARQNVVHEVGLFQGRLGFSRAIVLIEQGCTSFTNISGLVYISFPKGNIEAIFEKVRGTLEAAALVKGSA